MGSALAILVTLLSETPIIRQRSSPAYPQINGVQADRGSFDVIKLEEGQYEFAFDLFFETAEGVSKQFEGEAMLYLP